MLDELTDLIPTPDKTGPQAYHKFAATVLEMAWKEQDVALIGLATNLSTLIIFCDTPGVSFLRMKNPSARVNLTVEELPSEVKKFPSQETESKIEQLKKKGFFLYGLGDCWSCFFRKDDDKWIIFSVNSRFSTKYVETPLNQLLGPLLKSNKPLLGDGWNKHVSYVIDNLKIYIEAHDHDYDPNPQEWERWKYEYHNDMGVRIRFTFDHEVDAKDLWRKIIALNFEDLFLPEFVILLPKFVEAVPEKNSRELENDPSNLD